MKITFADIPDCYGGEGRGRCSTINTIQRYRHSALFCKRGEKNYFFFALINATTQLKRVVLVGGTCRCMFSRDVVSHSPFPRQKDAFLFAFSLFLSLSLARARADANAVKEMIGTPATILAPFHH